MGSLLWVFNSRDMFRGRNTPLEKERHACVSLMFLKLKGN
jgi:hypothetical protein